MEKTEEVVAAAGLSSVTAGAAGVCNVETIIHVSNAHPCNFQKAPRQWFRLGFSVHRDVDEQENIDLMRFRSSYAPSASFPTHFASQGQRTAAKTMAGAGLKIEELWFLVLRTSWVVSSALTSSIGLSVFSADMMGDGVVVYQMNLFR